MPCLFAPMRRAAPPELGRAVESPDRHGTRVDRPGGNLPITFKRGGVDVEHSVEAAAIPSQVPPVAPARSHWRRPQGRSVRAGRERRHNWRGTRISCPRDRVRVIGYRLDSADSRFFECKFVRLTFDKDGGVLSSDVVEPVKDPFGGPLPARGLFAERPVFDVY
jgi:hypothetical protein